MKRKEKRKPAIVELSSLKFDMPMSSLQIWPVKIRAASSMGWWVMWKGVPVPCADFLLWANQPRQFITQCTRQAQELMWPWMQLWSASIGCGQLWFFFFFFFLVFWAVYAFVCRLMWLCTDTCACKCYVSYRAGISRLYFFLLWSQWNHIFFGSVIRVKMLPL